MNRIRRIKLVSIVMLRSRKLEREQYFVSLVMCIESDAVGGMVGGGD